MSKGADESVKSMDDEVAKDRLEVFKRREQLRKKTRAMRSKILALQKLKTKQWKASAAKDAPVVRRSQLVRAACTGNTTEIHRLMGMETVISVVDEFEQVSDLDSSTMFVARCVFVFELLLCTLLSGQRSERPACGLQDGPCQVCGSVA